MTLLRTIGGFYDDTVCLDWSPDSMNVIMGAKDLAVRVYHNVQSKKMSMTVLSGHRDRLVGTFFSHDNQTAYSIARCGAVFTWTHELVEWIPAAVRIARRKANKDKEPSADSEEEVERSDDEKDRVEVERINAADESIEKRKKSLWKLTHREFLWEAHTEVTDTTMWISIPYLLLSNVFAS